MKNTIFGIIIGVLVAVLGIHVYLLYSMRSLVIADHGTLAQIVDLINKSAAPAAK